MNMVGGLLGQDKILDQEDKNKQGFDLRGLVEGTQGPFGGAPMKPPGQHSLDPNQESRPMLNDFLKYLIR